MRITNLVKNYHEDFDDKDKSRYLQSFPELFEHYFSYWSDESLPFFKDKEVIARGEQLILKGFPVIEKKMRELSIDLNDIDVVLFVGQNVSNGHAALLDGTWTVWLPVEAYASKEQVDIFVTHEMVHAVHYKKHPELYFSSINEKQLTSRQVITEGLATYISMLVAGVNEKKALWADFLSDEQIDQWMNNCEKQIANLAITVLERWDESAQGLFQANDSEDIMKFRAGYYLGMKSIKDIVKDRGIAGLLDLNGEDLTREVYSEIKRRSA